MTLKVPKSLLCPSRWDWILPVEFYFSVPETQRGKVTCMKFQFVSSGARDTRKSPRELGGKSDSIWPSTADEGSPDISETLWCWNSPSCAPGPWLHLLWCIAGILRPVSQQEWVAAPQSCKGHHRPEASWMWWQFLRAQGKHCHSFLWLPPGGACDPVSVSALGHLLVTGSKIQWLETWSKDPPGLPDHRSFILGILCILFSKIITQKSERTTEGLP